VWRRPLSEMFNAADSASDTQSVLFNDTGTVNLALTGDSAHYRVHRIDFVNNSSISLVISDVALTSSNSHFTISQRLPGVPDTIKPGEKFSVIIHFFGDTSGTIYLDTIVLTIDHALTSFYVRLNGLSFGSKSAVPQNSGITPFDIQSYPNPSSGLTTIRFSNA